MVDIEEFFHVVSTGSFRYKPRRLYFLNAPRRVFTNENAPCEVKAVAWNFIRKGASREVIACAFRSGAAVMLVHTHGHWDWERDWKESSKGHKQWMQPIKEEYGRKLLSLC